MSFNLEKPNMIFGTRVPHERWLRVKLAIRGINLPGQKTESYATPGKLLRLNPELFTPIRKKRK